MKRGPRDIRMQLPFRPCCRASMRTHAHAQFHARPHQPIRSLHGRKTTSTTTNTSWPRPIATPAPNTTSGRHAKSFASQATATATATVEATTTDDLPKVLINDLRSQELVVDFNDGVATRYPSFWLRDHCPCEACTHPDTKQRQVDTFALSDADNKAVEAKPTPAGLHVIWGDAANHASLFPWAWLQEHVPFTATPAVINPRGTWQHVSPAAGAATTTTTMDSYPTVDYDEAMTTDRGLSTLLANIRTYGFTFISSTPATGPEATEALANRIAFIRQTHYGGFWEVVSRHNPTDTAYTNLYLPNHTDNTYFTEPCGLQMFHCLSHTAGPESSLPGRGGESTFVDGFAAAAKLHVLNREYYNVLAGTRIVSHASGDPVAGTILNTAVHSPGFPVFTHLTPSGSAKTTIPQNLSVIRWNNNDRHVSTSFTSHQSMKTWYEAARLWNSIIHSPEFEIVVKLQPGRVVVFDNWRVLHGRKAFEGVRRLCGAYIGMDDFLAKGRLVDERVRVAAAAEESAERV